VKFKYLDEFNQPRPVSREQTSVGERSILSFDLSARSSHRHTSPLTNEGLSTGTLVWYTLGIGEVRKPPQNGRLGGARAGPLLGTKPVPKGPSPPVT